jgi:hypothetical protein
MALIESFVKQAESRINRVQGVAAPKSRAASREDTEYARIRCIHFASPVDACPGRQVLVFDAFACFVLSFSFRFLICAWMHICFAFVLHRSPTPAASSRRASRKSKRRMAENEEDKMLLEAGYVLRKFVIVICVESTRRPGCIVLLLQVVRTSIFHHVMLARPKFAVFVCRNYDVSCV